MRAWRHRAGAALGALGVLAGQAALLAWQAQGGFVKVPDSQLAGEEHLPATPLVFIAYAFVWVALLVYVFTIWRRLGRVERELADVAVKLRSRAGTRS